MHGSDYIATNLIVFKGCPLSRKRKEYMERNALLQKDENLPQGAYFLYEILISVTQCHFVIARYDDEIVGRNDF